ncbi:MAG: dicarboxylate transporter subunit DctM [Deltaproteobacteria bacterium]|nr:dicarboxylate transporter subunit DctM [Deltaproteobacteria bacterium]
MDVALPFISLLVALLLGMPIAFALAGAGILGIWLVKGDWNLVLVVLRAVPFNAVGDYNLSTVPMFILMAYLSSSAGLARDLYTAAANWLSSMRGGLAIATVFACGIFGAMSGASVAAAAAMSNIAISNMRRFGYSDELAAGSVGVGATLDILIPPSVPMVIYGICTQTSIGQLLVAGVVPGIILGIFLALSIYVWVLLSPSHAPTVHRVPWDERFRSLFRIWPSLLLILVVLTLLYKGIATPTEVGALGAFMAAVIGVAMGRLTWPGALDALKGTICTSAMIFMIFMGANIFGYYVTMSKIPQQVVAAIMQLGLNRWVVVVGIIVGYFVISMFMDEIPLLLLTLPLSFPMITSLGFDPVWFGVLSMMMIAMGLIFPPVGMIAFVVSATANVPLGKVYRGTSVLLIAIVLATAVLMIFPETALWLPSRMR